MAYGLIEKIVDEKIARLRGSLAELPTTLSTVFAAAVHAARHAAAGADPLKLDDLAAPDDNTDLNALTTKHGLMPKGTGSTSTFYRSDMTQAVPAGAGNVVGPASSVEKEIALFDGTTGTLLERATGTGIVRVASGVYGTPGNVVESEITLADNTTNNASTSAHGFLKKLSNVATEFINGAGNWATPGGSSGGLVLLESHTASSSASLNFTTCISSTYDTYLIEVVNILPATNGVRLLWRASTDGGSSYDSGQNYATAYHRWSKTGDSVAGGASATSVDIGGELTISNDATEQGISGSYRFSHPLGTAGWKKFFGSSDWWYNGTPELLGAKISAAYKSATAVNAFQFFMDSGNIASGTIRVYGLAL